MEGEPQPGVDYGIAEIVRCRTQKEKGVHSAITECSTRYLRAAMSLSVAKVIVILGPNAAEAFRAVF